MGLTRRELVAAFLGAAAANAGCRRAPKAREPVPGALIDRAVDTGHLLRQPAGALPRIGAESVEPVDVLIVGGGIAGLSAAWRLQSAGVKRLRVVELEDALGGTSRSGRNSISAFPWGAHYLPAPLEEGGPVVRLLREMGAVTGMSEAGAPQFAEQLLIREPDERLFYRGSWYEGLYLRAGASPEDLAQLDRFQARTRELSALRDGKGRKAFRVPVASCSDDADLTALDRLSFADWLAREGFTSQRLLWSVDYACRDDFGAPAARVSAWAGLWYFCARREGQEDNAGYLSWPEGNGRLVAQLGRGLDPAQRQLHTLVHTLAPDPATGGWIAHAFDAEKREPRALRARQVIFAGPRFVAPHVIEPWRREPPAFVRSFQYGPWVVANLTVSAPPRSRGFPLCWDNVLYESRSLGYVVATHQAEVADETGPTVLTWYYPLDGADVRAERERLLSAQYPEWEQIVMADLRGAHSNIDEIATRLEVMRWGHAMIRPTPGFIWSADRAAAARGLSVRTISGALPEGASAPESLHFAHTDLGGMALFEEANWHGVRAAERVLAGLEIASETWL